MKLYNTTFEYDSFIEKQFLTGLDLVCLAIDSTSVDCFLNGLAMRREIKDNYVIYLFGELQPYKMAEGVW